MKIRKTLILLCSISVIAGALSAQQPATEPTPQLKAWQELRYGMFIHFGMSTFTGRMFGKLDSASTVYAPTRPDPAQWLEIAKKSGMKYAVLTTKHHYGHALWPSAVSDFTVATSSNTTDVVRLFVDACRANDIKPGFYYSLGWDSWHMQKMTPYQYERFVHDQIRELLTQYGPITMLWFDIPWDVGIDMAGTLVRLYDHCKSLQPDCLILLNQGFVDGRGVESVRPSWFHQIVSEWPVPLWPKDIINGEMTVPPPSGHNPWINIDRKVFYLPMEVCDTLGHNEWFWGENDDPRPARQLFELYRRSVGRNANLLLNAGPDKTGRIPEGHARRFLEVAELIAHPETVEDSILVDRPATASDVRKEKDLACGPERAVDMDVTGEGNTRWATEDGVKTAWLEVDLGGEKTFARATVSEFRDAVRAFEIQVPAGKSGWKAVYKGGPIGGYGVDVTFRPVKARKVRLAITDSTEAPSIWDFALYKSARRPGA
jgi:alpha-L-fucosidase